jgi:hypothetical protein
MTAKSALAMTAALVLKRFGDASDIPLLESMTAKLKDYDHYQAPLHGALVDALGELYVRAGIAEVRAAAVRASELKGKADDNDKDIKPALSRALGRLGYPTDMDQIKEDAAGLAEMYRRMGRADEMRAAFYEPARWSKLDANAKIAVLSLVSKAEPTEKTFQLLGAELPGNSWNATRGLRYGVAQAWADLVARRRLTKGLAQAITAYLNKHGVDGTEETWGVLYAYVLAAEQAGGPELLVPLERIMSVDPDSLHYNHEQMYFSTPEVWAKALIRNGKFAEYAAPTLGADGAPQPSRLQKMLIDAQHPMMAAAALRAIALARDPSFRPKEAEVAESDVPKIALVPVRVMENHHDMDWD